MFLGQDRHNVELHLHLDGASRLETLFDLFRTKSPNLGSHSLDSFATLIKPKEPYNLTNFLKGFDVFLPLIAGDAEALSRITTEFVEDCAIKGGHCYVETRLAPFLVAGLELDPDGVVRVVLDSMKRASQQYECECRLILCIMRRQPETAADVLQLARKYQAHGVVGIDVAGDENDPAYRTILEPIVRTYQQAHKHGIHRTVHAGENGPAMNVYDAIHSMYTERIGHGYHVLDDPIIYDYAKRSKVHFEVCPTSSFLTGAVDSSNIENHTLVQFAKDRVNFSISTDDPLMTDRWALEEAQFVMSEFGLTPTQLVRANFNAAMSAFIDKPEERDQLINHLITGIGARTIRG